MLSRILAALSIVSLLLTVAVLVFWWRSYSHIDHLAIANNQFTTMHGYVIVTTTQHPVGEILHRSDRIAFKQVLGGSLVVPAFWLAIWIRSKLPRPPGRGPRDDYLPP